MKKMIAALCSLTTVLSGTSIMAFADTPVPVEVEPAVYEKLLETTWICDPNQDGIVTEEELRKTDRLIIDMDGISDLSWFEYLDNCKMLCVTGGSITDYSTVKNLPKLTDLQMHSVPITDISFVKEMNLENCTLDDMPQITMEQRLEVAQWDEEITIEQGFQKRFVVTPRNILGDELKCKMYIDDISVARITNGFNASSGTTNSIYAVESGKTAFHIYAPDEIEVISGTITVTESTPVNPQLGDGLCNGIRDTSYYYDKNGVALQNGTLYG
ncbi:MAG: hypothetical protein K2J40_10700, partial [Ruminococcus sp.]|nr:hypothetical protein [Ruminococcus sp.]